MRKSLCYDSLVMQRVFVTGGTGFVGKHVVRALLARGFLVRCLVRPGSESELRGFESIDRVPGDVLRPEGLVPSAEGCAALVHLVGIIRERRARGVTFERLHVKATLNMLGVARDAGIPRYVQMSALGARPAARSRYHQTKWEAEEAVRHSGTDWTIFRPSIILGPGDQSISVLAGLIRRLPVVPVLGDGQYRLQPIAVEHVAEGFARALRTAPSVGQTYEVGGPSAHTFVDILDRIGAVLGRTPVRKVHVPLSVVKPITRALEWLPLFPLTLDQILMLEEESVTDPTRFYHDFDITPESLDAGLRRLVAAS
jgi:NADH dehydrogenase